MHVGHEQCREVSLSKEQSRLFVKSYDHVIDIVTGEYQCRITLQMMLRQKGTIQRKLYKIVNANTHLQNVILGKLLIRKNTHIHTHPHTHTHIHTLTH